MIISSNVPFSVCRVIYNNFALPPLESKAKRTGIQLLGVVVANRMPPFNPATAGNVDEQKLVGVGWFLSCGLH